MSFSSEVKVGLCQTALSRRCYAQVEVYGVLLYCSQFTALRVRISTESSAFATWLLALFHRAFQFFFDRIPGEGVAKRIFSIIEPDKLSALWSAFGHEPAGTLAHRINFAVLEEECCRLAFFRGAFLTGGSMIDPAKRYHLELSTSHLSINWELRVLLPECGLTPEEITRKANSITYFKQSGTIEDSLTTTGTPLAATGIMNAKTEKDLRGSINRRVGCGAADLDKAVGIVQGQIEAICRLEKRGMLEELPDKLKETVDLRVARLELILAQLVELYEPPVSKPVFNHCLRRPMGMART